MIESTDTVKQSPWTRPWFIASACVIGIIVGVGIILAILPAAGGGETANPAPQQTQAPQLTASAAADPTASICGLPTGSQNALGTAPANTTWELVGSLAVPTAPETYGPGKRDSGIRSCFAHSQTGALYAAANMVAVMLYGQDVQKPFYEQLIAKGQARDEALAAMAAGQTFGARDAPKVQIQGFQILQYDGALATVNIAAKRTDGALIAIPVPLTWEDGDWKFVIPQGGNPGTRQLRDLSGFIPWAGV